MGEAQPTLKGSEKKFKISKVSNYIYSLKRRKEHNKNWNRLGVGVPV